jgi:hypothetical protein
MATAAAAAATTTTATTTTAKTTRRDSRRDGDGRTDPHGRAAPRRSPAPHRAPHRAPHVPSRRRSAVVSRRRVSPSSRRRLAVAVAVAAPRAASNMPFLPRSQTPIASNPLQRPIPKPKTKTSKTASPPTTSISVARSAVLAAVRFYSRPQAAGCLVGCSADVENIGSWRRAANANKVIYYDSCCTVVLPPDSRLRSEPEGWCARARCACACSDRPVLVASSTLCCLAPWSSELRSGTRLDCTGAVLIYARSAVLLVEVGVGKVVVS